MKSIEKQSPARIIALGFLAVILTGSFILMLPACVKPGVDLHYVDALFTSTSAVCVTGLIAVDTADTFTAMGQTVVALLIQIGGLGVTSVGVGVILALGRRVNLKERFLKISMITRNPSPPKIMSPAVVRFRSTSSLYPVRFLRPPRISKPELLNAATEWNRLIPSALTGG